jgi:hypothetical protein
MTTVEYFKLWIRQFGDLVRRKASKQGSKSDPLIENSTFYFRRPRFVAIEIFGPRAFAEKRAPVWKGR